VTTGVIRDVDYCVGSAVRGEALVPPAITDMRTGTGNQGTILIMFGVDLDLTEPHKMWKWKILELAFGRRLPLFLFHLWRREPFADGRTSIRDAWELAKIGSHRRDPR
jgi:hypothetical protein